MITPEEIFRTIVTDHRPQRATPGSVGWDCRATRRHEIKVGSITAIPLGFALHLPYRWTADVRARSSLAKKQGLWLANGVGTIDTDYADEVFATVYAFRNTIIEAGDRIVQLIIVTDTGARYWGPGDYLTTQQTRRGGYGSTGR